MEDFKRDYPELLDKEITLIRWEGNKIDKVIIVGFDHSIGFSLVSSKDRQKMIFCGHGPLAPKWAKHYKDPQELKNWDTEFEFAVGSITATGALNVDEMLATTRTSESGVGGNASMASCSFNQ